jgi:hypothetical protein
MGLEDGIWVLVRALDAKDGVGREVREINKRNEMRRREGPGRKAANICRDLIIIMV